MKINRIINLTVFSLLILPSASGSESEPKGTGGLKDPTVKSVAAVETYKKIKVPRSIIDKIEKAYLDQYKVSNPESVERDIDLLLAVERNLFEVEMEVWGAENSPLQNHLYRINFPAGGGVVDLNSLLIKERGTFELKLKVWKGLRKEADSVKALFVSQAPKRKVDAFNVGSGCNKVLEITDFYNSTLSKSLKLNATKGIHIGVVGGIFIFYSLDDKAINIAVVRIIHSEKEFYFCES